MPIVGVQIFLDGLDELGNTVERVATNASLSQLAKPAFYQIKPGRAGGDKVQPKTGMSLQPLLDVGMGVSSLGSGRPAPFGESLPPQQHGGPPDAQLLTPKPELLSIYL